MGQVQNWTGNIPGFIQPLYKYAPGQSPFWSITKAGGPGNSAMEGGIDIPAPNHTPVYSLGAGTLESSHLFWHNPPNVAVPSGGAPGYGVVTVRTDIPGYGLNDVYYQHIDINPALPVSMGGSNPIAIAKGQLLGWSKSPDPAEVEVGVNPTGWGPVWGSEPHPGPWVDPETRIRALVDADPNFNWGSGSNTSGGSGTFGQGVVGIVSNAVNAWKVTGANPIAPDAGIAAFFVGLDVALELQNPFDVNIDTSSTDFTVLGIDTGIPNPASDARAVFEGAQQIGINMVQDLSALAFRTFFIIIGLVIMIAIGQQIQSRSTDQALAPVGGKQGAFKLITGLV